MIFNTCIYGNINTNVGKLVLHYYDKTLGSTISKELLLESNNYQFNLGDRTLLDINTPSNYGDVCLIEYIDESDNRAFSDVLIIEPNIFVYNYNIDITTGITESVESAGFNISENIVKTTNHKISELQLNLYSYFNVSNITDNKTEYEGNVSEFYFIPSESKQYKIEQRSLNKRTNIITDKSYSFNAIVSSATITRSSKCKEINDSAKILFMSDEQPNITVIKDDTIFTTGLMADEGNTLWSWNFVFPSAGHYCFRIDVGDESFLASWRVNKNNMKVYYIDENFKNDSLSFDLYYVNDTSTVILSDTLNNIGNGLHSSDELEYDYGDYMFSIKGEYFVTSFEECSGVTNQSDGLTSSSEEIYWIFPNNLSD